MKIKVFIWVCLLAGFAGVAVKCFQYFTGGLL